MSWSTFVAVGDSFTEGVGDVDPATGRERGWADRVAAFLARQNPDQRYANLAVRGQLLEQIVREQVEPAVAMAPDLVSICAAGNDLLRPTARPSDLAARLDEAEGRLTATGADVLVVSPVVPPWPFLEGLHRRTAAYAAVLGEIATGHGARVLDLTTAPEFLEPGLWSGDRVHLSSHGHRLLSYRVAAALGVPGAAELGALDAAMHESATADAEPQLTLPRWLWTHARPWAARRVRGRTAGDGIVAKHDALVPIAGGGGQPLALGRRT
jgi:phosphatidylinositol alpha 1,6-mannosyltransferase